MNTLHHFTLATFALSSGLMADEALQPLPMPEIAICREAPAPLGAIKELKGMEANSESIQSMLKNEETKTVLDKLKAPLVITSLEQALKHLTRESMEKIADEVDFETQQVAVFAWQGSGEDRLMGRMPQAEGAEATFTYLAGRTRDLKPHCSIFAMPQGANIQVHELQQRIIRCGVGELQGGPRPLPEVQLKVVPLPQAE